jgi:hypothetical protein
MTAALDNLEALLAALRRWKPTMEAALEHGRDAHTFDDIVGMVMANRVLFFSFEKCFLVMERVEYPQFAVFHCFLAGGNMEAVMEAQTQMAQVGRQLGCKYLSFSGRSGWERKLKDRGWSHVATTMYCPIKEESNEQRREGRAADAIGQVARCH